MSQAALAKKIFLHAVELSDGSQRAAYAARACDGDPQLRAAVDRLLGAWSGGQGFLERPALLGAPTREVPPRAAMAEVSETVGSLIGPYKLLEQIGEGGMGVVYMAEQERPVRRRVALKVIKLGMDTRQVVARFEAERQALAMMDHPNIARVLDAGATETGRPYFVMELVRGSPITEYCDKHKVGPRERLALFIAVCHAVQHAHHKGVIHRDLKPSNILVTLGDDGKPSPKVIDFGIAKAIHHRLTDKTLFTEHRQLIGTPQYMSPEQAEADAVDVDTRTDVYSLGVLLYELLTGTTPIEGRQLAKLAIERVQEVIREWEPPRPSTRLSTLGNAATAVVARRGVEPAELARLLRGELDWVVMRALEKDRTRRYETPLDLARDIERHLADEPVEACPPSRGYRLRKLLRKRRKLLLTSAAFAAILVAATAVSIGYAVRAHRAQTDAKEREAEAHRATAEAREATAEAQKAREAEARAKREAEERAAVAAEAEADTRAFADFLTNHVLAASRPEGMQGGIGSNVTLVEALEAAESSIPQVFLGRPVAEAITRQELGITWRNLGRYEEAERDLLRALAIHEQQGQSESDLAMGARHQLVLTLVQAGRAEEAVPLAEESLRVAEKLFGPDEQRTLVARGTLGSAYSAAHRHDEGIRILSETIDRLRLAPQDPAYPALDTLRNNLALALAEQGRLEEAERLYLDAIEGVRRLLGESSVPALHVRANLGRLYMQEGRAAEALKVWQEIFPEYQAKLGPDHIDSLSLGKEQAVAHGVLGRPPEAARILEESIPRMDSRLGKWHRLTLEACNVLAHAYTDLGRPTEALELASRRAELVAAVLEERDPARVGLRYEVARALSALYRPAEAARVLEELLAFSDDARLREDPLWPEMVCSLAWEYVRLHRGAEAETRAREALDDLLERTPRDEDEILRARDALAAAWIAQDRAAEAVPLLEELLPLEVARNGSASAGAIAVRNNLAVALDEAGRPSKAMRVHEENLRAAEATLGKDHPEAIRCRTNFAGTQLRAGDLEAAERLCKESLALAEAKLAPDHEFTFEARVQLEKVFLAQERFPDAEALGRKALEQSDRLFPGNLEYRVHLAGLLGSALLGQERWGEAEPLLRESVDGGRELEPDAWPTFRAMSQLGEALLGLGKLKEAAPLIVEGYRGLKGARKDGNYRAYLRSLRRATERLAELAEARGKPAEAARFRAEAAKMEGGRES